jgi:outer membrane protein TolC
MKKCSIVVAAACLFALGLRAHAITLDQALARTLENNPAIRQAKAGVEQASGRRLVFRATGLPDIRTLTPAGVQGGQRAGEKNTQPFAFARGALTQPLFNMGVPPAYRRGNIEVLLAKQRLNIAAMEQLHTARLAFYTAAYNSSLGTLAEAQRERLKTNAQTQADRYQAGQTDRGAMTVARLLEQQLQPRVEDARRLREGALLKLAQTMGDDLGRGTKLPTADGELQFAQLDLSASAAAESAIEERADLKLARLLVRAAKQDERIVAAGYYPAISASISGDYIPVSDIRRGSEGSARRSDDIISSEARAGGIFTWRVIDNGRVAGAAAQQKAAREINELVLARLEEEVPRELTRIENNLRALDARQAALLRAVTAAEQTTAAVQNNLAEGLASQLEYRTAESSYLESKAGLLSVAYEQNVARAEWDRATGRYFQFSDDSNGNVP